MRLGVIECTCSFGICLENARNLVTPDSSERLSYSSSAETFAALAHGVAADSPCVLAVDVSVFVLVRERQHLVLVE